MKRRNRISRVLAVLLAVSLPAQTAAAAPPAVTTDETVYANLDYYGNVTEVRVVKACDLNGNTGFTDYGSYERVSNMSNHAVPVLTPEGVTWDFTGQERTDSRFYFECTPTENRPELPWRFDVDYKLNGVPKRAEELAGASGLVEIDVKAIPNASASAYYRSNMLLVCGMLVDTADAYSFAAPGAQMQTVGSKRAALYLATPGQEITFTFQIGSDSFESMGALLAMAPATLSQLDEIHRLREAKDRMEDAAKAIDRSLDELLDTLSDAQGSIGTLREGVRELDRAREEIHSSMDGIYGATDGLQASLDGFHQSVQELNGVADGTEIDLLKLDDDLQQTAHDLGLMKRRFREINSSLQRILLDLKGLQPSMTVSDRSAAILGAVDEFAAGTDYLVGADTLAIPEGASQSDYLEDLKSALDRLYGQLGALDVQDLVKRLREIQAQLNALQSQLGKLPGTLEQVFAELTEMTDSVSKLLDSADDMLEDVVDVVWDAENTSDAVTKLFDSVKTTMKSLDPLLGSAQTFVGTVEDALKSCGQTLNRGTARSLKGLEGLLDQTARGLGRLDSIRENKQIIKNTIEDEWDRLDGELGLLDIDTGAERVSFTSGKNPEPESLQIILRTREISLEDQKAAADLEPTAQDEGVLARIKNILVTIWNNLKALFD